MRQCAAAQLQLFGFLVHEQLFITVWRLRLFYHLDFYKYYYRALSVIFPLSVAIDQNHSPERVSWKRRMEETLTSDAPRSPRPALIASPESTTKPGSVRIFALAPCSAVSLTAPSLSTAFHPLVKSLLEINRASHLVLLPSRATSESEDKETSVASSFQIFASANNFS